MKCKILVDDEEDGLFHYGDEGEASELEDDSMFHYCVYFEWVNIGFLFYMDEIEILED